MLQYHIFRRFVKFVYILYIYIFFFGNGLFLSHDSPYCLSDNFLFEPFFNFENRSNRTVASHKHVVLKIHFTFDLSKSTAHSRLYCDLDYFVPSNLGFISIKVIIALNKIYVCSVNKWNIWRGYFSSLIHTNARLKCHEILLTTTLNFRCSYLMKWH